ncbi:MAG TPA: multidrug efflux SMR transporter [Candidatus Corynebacterium avicola]|uniref:Multidrug efflux SMR transporter n=1 Tax=Candidatus Corynebacterium avicola TaxID=2838527 RepID=A0A9D1RND9_9CORY|nr:multidrug efflux SMR transporter [Candidatus Corynebacterium avicola]
MAWFVLIISGLFEAMWATALGRIEGFSRFLPIAVFIVGITVSMTGLWWAMRDLPTGTAYAVWVAVGAVTTVAYAAATGDETLNPAKVIFLGMIIGGVVGLKLSS